MRSGCHRLWFIPVQIKNVLVGVRQKASVLLVCSFFNWFLPWLLGFANRTVGISACSCVLTFLVMAISLLCVDAAVLAGSISGVTLIPSVWDSHCTLRTWFAACTLLTKTPVHTQSAQAKGTEDTQLSSKHQHIHLKNSSIASNQTHQITSPHFLPLVPGDHLSTFCSHEQDSAHLFHLARVSSAAS